LLRSAPMAIYIPDRDHRRDIFSPSQQQQQLRRTTPSLPALSYSSTKRNMEYSHHPQILGTGYSPFPPPTPFPLTSPATPKPLSYDKKKNVVRHSPSMPLRPESSLGSTRRFSSDSFDDHSDVDWRFV